MLHEELTRVRKYFTALRDPDKNMDLMMTADSADLIEMNLYSIEERLRELELRTITPAALSDPPQGGNIVRLADFKNKTPKQRNVK